MITTFEKRFEWSTSKIGLFLASNDIGYLSTVMFIAHFGSTSHRPRLFAICGTIYGLTNILVALPYFIYGSKYSAKEIFSNTNQHFDNQTVSDNSPFVCLAKENVSSTDKFKIVRVQESQSHVAFAIFMATGILEGVVAGPFWNVGIALIDDIAKEWSGVVIGVVGITC